MMTWWHHWQARRERRTIAASMRRVDGIAFFIQLNLQLVRKNDGEWLVSAPEWRAAAKGSSAPDAFGQLWTAIQYRNDLQHYMDE